MKQIFPIILKINVNNIKHNLTETDLDINDVNFQLERKIQAQEM